MKTSQTITCNDCGEPVRESDNHPCDDNRMKKYGLAPNKAQTATQTLRSSRHSPLPWKVVTMDSGQLNIYAGASDHILIAKFDNKIGVSSHNAALIVRAVNGYDKALQALRDLTAEIKLGTLNVRKDYSLMVAHAAATKVLHESEAQ